MTSPRGALICSKKKRLSTSGDDGEVLDGFADEAVMNDGADHQPILGHARGCAFL
jgi:hypothetical protein